jgi:EmrB/QacA subfamily drug resistance transporter
MLIGPFLGTVDFFIVNIGIPSIRTSLGASLSQMQLVIAGYGLAYAVCLITGGRLGDIFGRKKAFMVGLTGFTLASALCGWAPSAQWLVLWRLLQGCAAAVMFPQALSFIHVNFSGSAKRLAFSAYGAMLGCGSIIGQIVGGFLIDANLFGLQWRPIFLINLPLGIVTLGVAALVLRESRSAAAQHLDLIGTGIVSAGLFLFSLPFIEGKEAGWPLWAWFALAASLPILAGFYRFEEQLAKRGKSPLVDPALLKQRGFLAGLGVTCLYFAGHVSMILVLSLYLQLSLKLDPTQTGLALVPFSFGFVAGSAASAKLSAWLERGALHLGAMLIAGALVAFMLEAAKMGERETLVFLVASLLYGIGRGMVTAPLYHIVLSRVRPAEAGAASGILSAMQQVANSVGIALIGAATFGILPKIPAPTDYANAFVLSCLINLVLLLLASALLFCVPNRRA